jgi:hypothetical protein
MTIAIIVLSVLVVLLVALVLFLTYGISNLQGQRDTLYELNKDMADKLCLQQELVYMKHGTHLPYSIRALERAMGELGK